MTNVHHDPASHAASPGAPAGPDYEGFDPELPEHHQQRKILGLSSVQIGASAMAAVTSALAASFFGVAGTLIGAAVGSVISTIAGAMYAESMRRAAGRLRDAQTVVVQHVPFGTGQHPSQLPSSQALTQIVPAAQADETIVLPAGTAAAQAMNGTAVNGTAVNGTAVNGTAASTDLSHAAATTAERMRATGSTAVTRSSLAPTIVSGEPVTDVTDVPKRSDAVPGTEVPGAALLDPEAGGAGTGGPDQPGGKRPWWRRPIFALPVVGIAGFLIAIGIITGIEGLTGHTLSGGSGTSLSRIGGGSSSAVTPTPSSTDKDSTPSVSASTATVTATPTAEATGDPVVPTAAPSTTSSAAPDATSSTTAPDVTPTASSSAEASSGVDAVATGAPAN